MAPPAKAPSLRIVQLPAPPSAAEDSRSLVGWLGDLVKSLQVSFSTHQHQFPQALSGELRLSVYTIATKPTAGAAGEGAVICVSDEVAGQNFQGSVGGAWVYLG